MSEVSLQKERLTVPVWQELELSSQDPLILWDAVKATHTIVKQDNDPLTLFAAEAAYKNIKMRTDELLISYFNRIVQAIDLVKSRDVDVKTDRNYTEPVRVLRMVKGLDPVRFGELQLTPDQNKKWDSTRLRPCWRLWSLLRNLKLKPHPVCKSVMDPSKQCSPRQS